MRIKVFIVMCFILLTAQVVFAEATKSIPKAYGRLIQVSNTSSDRVKNLWFEATDGTIRRVSLLLISDDMWSVNTDMEIKRSER